MLLIIALVLLALTYQAEPGSGRATLGILTGIFALAFLFKKFWSSGRGS